jgi:[ribosomal protein S18]-alanine N-acetyltransferase
MIELRVVDRTYGALLSELHCACFPDGWGVASMDEVLRSPGVYAILAAEGEHAAGLALGRRVADEAELLTLGVAPEFRRQGLGAALVRAIASVVPLAAKLHLEVGADNPPALTLYRTMGFAQIGRRKDYYRRANGRMVDALTFAIEPRKLAAKVPQ